MPSRPLPVPAIVAGELVAVAAYLLGFISGGPRVLLGLLLGIPALILFFYYIVWGGEDSYWGAGWSLLGVLVSSLVAGVPWRTAVATFLVGIAVLLLASYISGRSSR